MSLNVRANNSQCGVSREVDNVAGEEKSLSKARLAKTALITALVFPGTVLELALKKIKTQKTYSKIKFLNLDDEQIKKLISISSPLKAWNYCTYLTVERMKELELLDNIIKIIPLLPIEELTKMRWDIYQDRANHFHLLIAHL